jgi:nucleoside-diphosphate kinase
MFTDFTSFSFKDVGRNVCHGSDAVESAQKEIALWFKPEELQSWKQASHDWVYEK